MPKVRVSVPYFIAREYILFSDFITIGGLPIIFNSLQTKETMLQWRAAEVLSVVVQNNPHCQSQVFAAGGLEILMHAVENSLDDQVKTKALYALSSE